MMVLMSGQLPEAIQLVALTAIVRLRDVDATEARWTQMPHTGTTWRIRPCVLILIGSFCPVCHIRSRGKELERA